MLQRYSFSRPVIVQRLDDDIIHVIFETSDDKRLQFPLVRELLQHWEAYSTVFAEDDV